MVISLCIRIFATFHHTHAMLPLTSILLMSIFLRAHHSSAESATSASSYQTFAAGVGRQRISINHGWRFFRSEDIPDGISYNTRPGLPSPAGTEILRPWILPSGNQFIKEHNKQHRRPSSEPSNHSQFCTS